MIEQQLAANWTPGFVFIGALFFIVGISVTWFADKIFWWWLNLLRQLGNNIATRIKTDPELWVPKVPSPLTIRVEIWVLRVTGIIFAGVAAFVIYFVLTHKL